MKITGLVIATILFLAGIAGTILPILPGVILIYAGMVIYGFMTGFATLTLYFYILQSVVLLLIFVVDFFASATSTRRFGGSKQAAYGALIGTILGLMFLGPLGIIIGPFLGATMVELIRGDQIKQAFRVGFGSVVGVFGGMGFKLIAEAVMIIYFFINILK